MAHKTMIGGTSYNITGGKSMVSGTTYNIAGGKTMINGTGYTISFKQPIYAMLYTSGNMVFQKNNIATETLRYSYTDDTEFKDTNYAWDFTNYIVNTPWYSQINNIKNIRFNTKLSPKSVAFWFHNARYLVNVNYTNLNIDSIIDMTEFFKECFNLTSSPVCGNKVTSMNSAYNQCFNLTSSPVCGPNVIDMNSAYWRCLNLTGSPVCGPNVTNMFYTYYECRNLTGSPVCGPNVIDMIGTYRDCYNLTGSPACGNKVINMIETYFNCPKLAGSPVCGPNVIDMSKAYYNCQNLTGSPVCGPNVTNMADAYYNCRNLTGIAVCGPNVTNMSWAYRNCYNLSAGNIYIYSKNVKSAGSCFAGKNNSRRYNIHVPANSTTYNTFIRNTTSSIVGANIRWTLASNGCMYNTTYRLYIYPNTSM